MQNQQVKLTKKKVLSRCEIVMIIIGVVHIYMDYSSTLLRDRVNFGGLL
jgi:hypothetical protein